MKHFKDDYFKLDNGRIIDAHLGIFGINQELDTI